jgi:hypothetical protein
VKGLCHAAAGGRLGATGASEFAIGGFFGVWEGCATSGAGGSGATGAVDPSAEIFVVSAEP